MRIKSRAPLRVGLAGGGTDLENYYKNYGGVVLNCTIDKYANVEIVKVDCDKTIINLLDSEYKFKLSEKDLVYDKGQKHCLISGVYKYFIDEFNCKYDTLQISTYVDAPPGSGLGTSSTLVVALVAAFANYYNIPLGEYEIAEIAFSIERVKLQLLGGKQDQYAASFGGLNLIEFKENGDTLVYPLRINNNIVAELESRIIMFYTGQSRSSENIIKDQIKSVSVNNQALVKMHQLKTNALDIKNALLKSDFDQFGSLLHEGWKIKKETSESISNSSIDEMYISLLQNGVIGGKVSGAGGGGYLTLFTEVEGRLKALNRLKIIGGEIYSFRLTSNGVITWRC